MRDFQGTKYECPRCGHITISHTRIQPRHQKCGARGCQRSLSSRHILE